MHTIALQCDEGCFGKQGAHKRKAKKQLGVFVDDALCHAQTEYHRIYPGNFLRKLRTGIRFRQPDCRSALHVIAGDILCTMRKMPNGLGFVQKRSVFVHREQFAEDRGARPSGTDDVDRLVRLFFRRELGRQYEAAKNDWVDPPALRGQRSAFDQGPGIDAGKNFPRPLAEHAAVNLRYHFSSAFVVATSATRSLISGVQSAFQWLKSLPVIRDS